MVARPSSSTSTTKRPGSRPLVNRRKPLGRRKMIACVSARVSTTKPSSIFWARKASRPPLRVPISSISPPISGQSMEDASETRRALPRVAHPERPEACDQRDEEDLADQRLEDGEGLRQPGGRRQVAEPECRDHDEAEIDEVRLVVRALLRKERTLGEGCHGDEDEGEEQRDEDEDADRAENRLETDVTMVQDARERHRQRRRHEERRGQQVRQTEEPLRRREEEDAGESDSHGDRNHVRPADAVTGLPIADRHDESRRREQRAPDRAPPEVVDELEQEDVREQEQE